MWKINQMFCYTNNSYKPFTCIIILITLSHRGLICHSYPNTGNTLCLQLTHTHTHISLSGCSRWSCEMKNNSSFNQFLSSLLIPPPFCSPLCLHWSLCFFTLLLQIDINIPTHPRLGSSDSLMCVFGNFTSNAVMVFGSQGLITCALPDPAEIPPTPDRQGRSTHGCTKVFLINGLSVPRVAEFAPASWSFKMTKTECFRADVPSSGVFTHLISGTNSEKTRGTIRFQYH